MADDEMEVFLQPPEYSSGGTVPGVPSDSVGLTIVSQPQPMMVPTPAVYKMDDLAPHNFMMLAVSVSVFCGFFHPTTLMCSIPAVILSVVSRNYSKSGKFHLSKSCGNSSAVLSVVAIIYGFVGIFAGLLSYVVYAVAAQKCGLSNAEKCL